MARDKDGKVTEFEAIASLIQVEIDYYRHGGILWMVLRQKLGNIMARKQPYGTVLISSKYIRLFSRVGATGS